MTTNELWTIGIAGYAAFISTFVLGWDAYKWLNSGPKVRLTASTGMKMVGVTTCNRKRSDLHLTQFSTRINCD